MGLVAIAEDSCLVLSTYMGTNNQLLLQLQGILLPLMAAQDTARGAHGYIHSRETLCNTNQEEIHP